MLKLSGVSRAGQLTGTAQRLVQTRLGAGLADWTVRVPIPPSCRDATITGVEMAVCDTDAPPNVSMSDALTARVHRTGQLADSAAVNVTVHCVPPEAPDATTAAPPYHATTSPHHADTRSTDEMLSKEQGSHEHISTEIVSSQPEPSDATSNEWISTVAMTTSTTTTTALPPTQRVTEPPTVAPTTEQIVPIQNKLTHSKEKSPHALKVTIKITPASDTALNEDQPQTYNIALPSSVHREPPAVKSRQALPALPARDERAQAGAADALYGALLQRYMLGRALSPLSILRPQALWPRRPRRPLLYLPRF
uniref:Uncharacterized protein n=1 Tax=Heliothis virescens TaxID=7102 RepID=A0A2A4JH21_HELVI